MSKTFNILTGLLIICVFFVMPAFAFETIDISNEVAGSSNPFNSGDLTGAKSLMWDIIKLLCALFLASIIINVISSGLSLNISSLVHSLQIRAHGINGLFIGVASIVGVLLALWIGLYLWNTYLVNL